MQEIKPEAQKEFNRHRIPAVKAYLKAKEELNNDDLVVRAYEKQGIVTYPSYIRSSFSSNPNTPSSLQRLLSKSSRSFNGLGPGLGFEQLT